ncbi:MAG TPA: adenylate/guanylate cyclase domain-containing protein [Candidatus Limnocylindrales bacterium]|nr:adenylate/guanylate cyclase domain-containing protein [Candidatus Limnocylindrales bacterium]
MTCTACGAENRAESKFCSECGQALVAGCPACGAPTTPGAKFCSECGERLASGFPRTGTGAPRVPGDAAGPGAGQAERRVVSVLFADLVGFTTLAEGRDAEQVRELLSRYFETSSEIIARYGGTVEKFIGDAVMAVWGAPTAHEDDAERAVRAALDLVGAVHALGEELGTQLEARAGVLTGEAAVTIGATNQGLVAGDLVNTAARVQSVAPPGTVLVGEGTRAAAERAIAFEPAGESVLKGKTAPVPVFRALRVVAKARGIGRVDSLEPPFVGRDAEFRLVRDAYHAVARDRRARLVSITGDAGIGKSRLAWEFSKYTDGLAGTMFWHEGRSPAYGEGISFWALSEMVRKRAGLLESDDDDTTRVRIRETLERHVPDGDERPFIEPCLLALLGLGEPPPGGRDRLFAGWRLFFERLAAEDPVVLLFEDIQWADDGQLDFIEYVMEWSQSYPIYVLTLARPELLDRRPTWGAARNATSLPLGPLDDAAMRLLLGGLVPGLPEAAARAILDRAGGVPLYAVEMVRMLVGSGRLEATEDGTYRAVASLDVIDVPPSLHALIAARLDALPAADRSLVQDASVLGQTFALPALAAVTAEGPEVLEPRLRSLVARDLLSLDTDPRSPERGQYGFVQALIREVAYGTLARRERRSRHLAAARYFEALGDEELHGVLATHYLAAFQAAPDGEEAHALATQARISLRAAAERAASLGASEQALAYFESAESLPGDERERLELLQRAADVAERSGRYERTQTLLSRALEHATALGDRLAMARASARTAEALLPTDIAGAERLAREGLVAFADVGVDSLPLLTMQFVIARAQLRQGHNAEAAAVLDQILTPAERTGDVEFVLRLLAARGATLPALGRPIEGGIILEGVMTRGTAAGLTRIAEVARINLSVTLADDDVVRGRDLSADGLADALRAGSRQAAAFFASNAGEYDLHIGDWDAGSARVRAVLDLGLEAADRLINEVIEFVYAVLRGERRQWTRRPAGSAIGAVEEDARAWSALAAGDLRGAIDHGLTMARDDETNARFAYLRVAIAAALVGDVTAALAARDESNALARQGRWVNTLAAATEAIATALTGDRAVGGEQGRAAVAALDAQGVHFDAALAALGLAAALRDQPAIARPFRDQARRMFEAVQSRPLLDLLDSVDQPTAASLPSAERAGVDRR